MYLTNYEIPANVYFFYETITVLDYEQSDECIDLTQ